MSNILVRRSIAAICDDYRAGRKQELETLIKAWKGIQELDPKHPNSFFMLAGYHGEPFRGAGWGSSDWWGGYCHHGNVLFPTWHRAYVYKLEKALQSIEGCENVTQPFWDEGLVDPGQGNPWSPVPWIFTEKEFKLDGDTIRNPLYSYTFQAGVYDNVTGLNKPNGYTKGPGYETKRYPLSGLVGTEAEAQASSEHNSIYEAQAPELLNQNVRDWLNREVVLNNGQTYTTGIREKYHLCLDAPNYTVFSNATSATQWNEDKLGVAAWTPEGPAANAVVPLESPHNSLHLAVGGFEMPDPQTGEIITRNPITGANGDMGENDTAGFDPIFFFHHTFVDRVFWLWQQKTRNTTKLEIIPRYPGTNSVDGQGPTPGVPGNIWLGMDTPLEPFTKDDGVMMTSADVVDIEGQLGYRYDHGSLESGLLGDPRDSEPMPPMLRVTGANRAQIEGSFAIHVWAPVGKNKKMELVSSEAVLSRRQIQGCANCQNHLNVKVHLPIYGLTKDMVDKDQVVVRVWTRAGDVDGNGATRLQPLFIQ